LQKLANGGTFGNKEEYMEPLNNFLAENRPKMQEFLQRCSAPIGEEDITLDIESVSWVASIVGIAGHIKLNLEQLKEELKKVRSNQSIFLTEKDFPDVDAENTIAELSLLVDDIVTS
jgi:hypothetical protein